MAQSSLTSTPLLFGADLLSNSASQQMPLGAYGETTDGRGYRYALVGAVATVAGKCYQSSALDATNYQPSGGLAVSATNAIGATSLTTSTSTTWTVNALAGGYLSFDAGTPAGTLGGLFRIKGNTATAGAASGVIYLDDPLTVATTSSSKFIVTPHPYSGIVIEPGTPTGVIVGVAPTIITAAQYGWIQTYGAASVLFTGTGVAGKAVGSLSGGTSGSSAPAIAATNILGYNIATSITAEYALIYLTIH